MRLYCASVTRMILVPSFLAAICAAACLLGPVPAAHAAGAPNWSGLDATHYGGPIPSQSGTLLAQRPLDPALSVAGAGAFLAGLFGKPE